MSAELAELLRKGTRIVKAGADPDLAEQRDRYWQTIVRAVESSDFDELMALARDAGRSHSTQGFDLGDAIGRTIETSNTIETALLEANDGAVPPLEIINEIADLRSMIAMAVAEGYKEEQESRRAGADAKAESAAKELLRAVMLAKAGRFATSELARGEEVPPLYEGGMRFHFVDYGKLRLYNLLPNGRCITLSILGPGDVFLQWRTESESLSCLCAEAMHASRIVTASESDMTEIVGAQPAAAVDVIANFARRLTESQVLIEDLLNNSVNFRLYRTLLELARQFGKAEGASSLIDYPLTHQRLADMIGSNRVTVTRKLHELQARGIIESRKNATIVLLDPGALTKLAGGGSS